MFKDGLLRRKYRYVHQLTQKPYTTGVSHNRAFPPPLMITRKCTTAAYLPTAAADVRMHTISSPGRFPTSPDQQRFLAEDLGIELHGNRSFSFPPVINTPNEFAYMPHPVPLITGSYSMGSLSPHLNPLRHYPTVMDLPSLLQSDLNRLHHPFSCTPNLECNSSVFPPNSEAVSLQAQFSEDGM